MAGNKTYRILIGGGGTGGHIFPAIAIADALKERLPGAEFLFVGARGRMEMEKVPEAGYQIEGLPVAGFQRRLTLKNLSFFFKLASSMLLARRIIRRFRPDLAIGVGGYASGPILKSAARQKVPILIQEQNSYAGVTNRLLARSAESICVAYEGMEKYFPAEKLVLTGNPIRENLLGTAEAGGDDFRSFGLEKGATTCLVVGGSLGARTLNESLMENIDRLNEADIQLIWQCGKYYQEEVQAFAKDKAGPRIKVMPFIKDMAAAYRVADVVISRAGALSISELCALGKAAILVPSPNVSEDHQTRNAEALVKRSAALMVADGDARSALVDVLLELSGDEKKRKELEGEILKMALPAAASGIAGEAIKILEEQ